MASWLFQGNPDRFDLDGYLQRGGRIRWVVRQEHLAREMRPGDRVFFWRAVGDSKRRPAGVVAAGHLADSPTIRQDDPAAIPFWRDSAEGQEEALRVSIELDPPTGPRCLRRSAVSSIPALADLRIFRMANETNYRLSDAEVAALETMWTEAHADSPVAWLLITLEPEVRQHAGNTGYVDHIERIYRFDSLVPNCKRIQLGDIAVLRSDRQLLGVARIMHLDQREGAKELRRCPSCRKTGIKARDNKLPRYRCSECRTEFDIPVVERRTVQCFEAHFGSSFVPTPDVLAIEQLRAACPTYNGQHAMQRIDLDQILPPLVDRYPILQRLLVDPLRSDQVAMERALTEAQVAGAFDSISEPDARERTLRAIALRRGQRDFRRALVVAYGGRCAISGCDADEALEAAHIRPYRGDHTNDAQNGLLLRADLHTLFDRGLIGIDTATWTVVVHDRLRGTTYEDLHGRRISVVANPAARPSPEALDRHRTESGI